MLVKRGKSENIARENLTAYKAVHPEHQNIKDLISNK